MFGPAWHCLTQFDVQADSVLQMVLDLGRYLDNHPIPDHEDIVNIIKDIVGTIVTSVNGKTGEVNLKLSDVTGTDSWPIWILTYAEYGELTDATMLDAYDNDGFRLLYVTAGSDPEKEPAFLMIPGRTFNPDGITRYIFTGGGGSGGGAVQSVNGKVGTVVLTADDVGALPNTYVPPAPPVTSVNTKTGEVVLSASDVGAATPADVSAVDAKVDAKYGPDNVPPYPVTGRIDGVGTSSYFVRGSNNVGVAVDGAGNLLGINSSGTPVKMYSPVNPPPVIGSNNNTSYFIKSNNPGKPNIYFGEVEAPFSGEDLTYKFGVPYVGTIYWVLSVAFVNANIPVGRCSVSNRNLVTVSPANSSAPGVGSSQKIVYMVFGA